MNTPTPTMQRTARYRRSMNFAEFKVGPDRYAVFSPLTGATALISKEKLFLLNRCDTFQTLKQHALSACMHQGKSPLHFSSVQNELNELSELGLLISEEQLIGRLGPLGAEPVPPPVSAICIPTKNRPEELQAAVESYAKSCREYSKKVEFFIADQSEDRRVQDENIAVLTKLKKEYGIAIEYAGIAEMTQMASDLAKHSALSEDTIRFALTNVDEYPVAVGASRNALTLATVGELVLQSDDDVVCQVLKQKSGTQKIELTSAFSPISMSFLSSAETATLAERFTQEDLISQHERLLGKSIADCAEPETDFVLNRLAEKFFFRPGPRCVWATTPGSAGESAIGNAFWFLFFEGAERESLIQTEEHYRYAMENQMVLRWVENNTISSGRHCCSMNLGLDNRKPLPPFLPVQTNEDAVFGALISLCTSGYFGFLSDMVLHLRPSRNHTKADLLKYASSASAGRIVLSLIHGRANDNSHGGRQTTISEIAEYLTDLGSMPRADFEQVLRSTMMENLSQLISDASNRLKRHNKKPAFWASDLESCVQSMQEAMGSERVTVAQDLGRHFDEAQARERMHNIVRRYGNMLSIWTHLRTAATELKSSGWQPFRSL